MRLNKVEMNFRGLLEAAPRQQNLVKLVHYVTTVRELLEQLGAETTPEGISRFTNAPTTPKEGAPAGVAFAPKESVAVGC